MVAGPERNVPTHLDRPVKPVVVDDSPVVDPQV
jgi:hypothetical protein